MSKAERKVARRKTSPKSRRTPRRSRAAESFSPRLAKALRASLGRSLAGMSGVLLGALVVWVVALQHSVVGQFELHRWDQPSLVFARPLQLDRGMSMTMEQLEFELQAAGYHGQITAANRPGQYARRGDSLQAHAREFVFADGRQPAASVQIRLTAERVSELRVAGEPVQQFRFDPAEIGSLQASGADDRKFMSLDSFPPLLVTAIQAVEDRQFKHHPGVDWHGLARAVWVNLRHGELRQGGSTITQQLVRNIYLSHDRTLLRKLNEMVMALALEQHFSKHDILEGYLNEVYLGQHGGGAVHGFPRASEYYFGRALSSLQAHELALLVGMVRGASWYNPRRHPERARQRRDVVLEMMHDTGLLSAAELARAQAADLGVTRSAEIGRVRYPAFLDLVRRQLRRDYSATDLQQSGLRIMTTLDPYQQHRAERALQQQLPVIERRLGSDGLQAAVVMLNAQTGDVMALVGDRQTDRPGFNRALDASRQIGSIVKPFIYLKAWSAQPPYTLTSRIEDAPISIRTDDGATWQPANFDRRAHGEVSLLTALLRSYNQATVRLGMQLGLPVVASVLQELGLLSTQASLHPSLLLGAVEATPLAVAAAYQPLAANGYQTAVGAVRQVLTGEQRLRANYPVRIRQVLPPEPLALLNYALTRVTAEGTARGLSAALGARHSIAGKTGTSNDQRDSWFVGYDRQRLAVVWVGRDDNQAAAITGANAALPLWADMFAGQPLQDIDVQALPGLYWYWVDQRNGLLSSADCASAAVLPFLAHSEPLAWSDCQGGLAGGDAVN